LHPEPLAVLERGEAHVFQNKDAIATAPVKNLKSARKFYEETLGLKPAGGQEDGALLLQSGQSKLLVYESKFAGTNRATAVTWEVGTEVEPMVDALKAKGVAFERYDLPDVKRSGDIHLGGGMKMAWFKDPDGNIHALVGR
jgi:catechol 2,3-dioxygenase-like lactoylglutathione lyase family enzyme